MVEVLGYFYETEMKKAYHEVWQDLLLYRPPWNMKSLMANLEK